MNKRVKNFFFTGDWKQDITRKIDFPIPNPVRYSGAQPSFSNTDTQGRRLWSLLHSQQNWSETFFSSWKQLIPGGCSCRKDADDILSKMPPRYDSPESWFEWTIEFHNAVNTKLNKPTVSMERARMLWRNQRPATDRTRAIITVANGTQFVDILNLTRPFMQSYADRVDADLIDLDNDTEHWGPMEKFRVWHFAKQYDEVLFVDADCVIKPSCPDLFSMYTQSIVCHDDWSRLYKTDWLDRERKAVAGKTAEEIQNTAQCLNSGVVLSRRSAADIWKRPDANIGTTHCAEQIWLEHCIEKQVSDGATLGRLDSRANWQWWFSAHDPGSFEAGTAEAWVVHFANAPDRVRKIQDFIKSIS